MAKKKISNTQFNLTQRTIQNLSYLNLTSTAKLVLIYLSSCYNPKNEYIFPKQETISNKLGISEASVVRAIKDLIKLNYCIKIRKKYSSNYYKFTEHFFDTIRFINFKNTRLNINYQLWKDSIHKKYNETCQECGKTTGIMHAHHIKEYANNPEKRYDISNGILLCEECHRKIHPWIA